MFSRKCTHHPDLTATHSHPCSSEASLSQCLARSRWHGSQGRACSGGWFSNMAFCTVQPPISHGICEPCVDSSHPAMSTGRKGAVEVPLRAERQGLECFPGLLTGRVSTGRPSLCVCAERASSPVCPGEEAPGRALPGPGSLPGSLRSSWARSRLGITA